MAMRFALHGRPIKEEVVPHLQAMMDRLKQHGADLQFYTPFRDSLLQYGLPVQGYPLYDKPGELRDCDVLLSLGGDGTLLEAITFIGSRKIPVLGINMGRLGFLATTGREEISAAIDELHEQKFKVVERSLIKVVEGEELFGGINFGLNEFAILKRDTSSMIVVHTYLNGEYLNSYWADGLLVSTPTGSTGYSLSCGGPLVMPHSNNFILAPVSPHNLNVRPLILSDDSVLSFEVEARSDNFLIALDSRSVKVPSNQRFSVKKEDFSIGFVELKNYNYLKTLRSKLNWGLDLRN